jgi:hypothetical protein
MKNYMLKTVVAAAIGCASISANAAITLAQPIGLAGVSTYVGSLGLHANLLVEDFDSVSNGSMTSPASTFGIYSGPGVENQYARPLNTAGNYLSVPQAGSGVPASATYTLNKQASIFGFYLGSPDRENTISFSLNGDPVGATVTMETLLGPTFQWNGLNSQSRYITLNAGGYFNEVTFGSTRIAMEVDNFTSAVPEPGEWAMLMAGLGVVSLIARRRKTKV